MTALDQYVRLESDGLWRAGADAQRRDISVSFGDATLVIADRAGRPLAHWSLPALVRVNKNERPAIFALDEDHDETLEITDDLMVAAIEQVMGALDRERPKPGKLRHWITGGLMISTLVLALFWLPGALTRQTLSVVPATKRSEVGLALFTHLQSRSGPVCRDLHGTNAAAQLAIRLFGTETTTQIVIVPTLPAAAVALPGDIIVLDETILQNSDDPAVAAGFVLAAHATRQKTDPLRRLLDQAGLGITFRLLTTGDIPQDRITAHADTLFSSAPPDMTMAELQPYFTAANVFSTPYYLAIDQTPPPIPQTPSPDDIQIILSDSDWVSLQNICDI